MNVGIKALLLLVALVLFLVGIFVDNPTDVWSLGFASLAGAFLVETLGMDRPLGGMGAGSTTTTRR